MIIWLLPYFVHIRCWQKDLRWWQPIRLHPVGCLAHNNTQMILWEHQIIMMEIQREKTLNSGNLRIDFIDPHNQGIATHLRCHHFQGFSSSTTRLYSTRHQARNQALVLLKDIRFMGHRGKHMISPKEDMVDHKCSPLSNSQDIRRHPQVHLEYLQYRLETIQSFGWPLLLPLHQENFPAHLVDPPFAFKRNDFSLLRDPAGQLLPCWPICLHCQIFAMTNTMQIMRATTHQTWAGLKAKPQITSTQPEFSLKQFAKRMGLPKFSTFDKWKTVWVAGFFENKHRSVIRGQNCLTQLRDGPLHWEMTLAD